MKIKSNKNLTEVTEKAKIACKTARHAVADHFPDIWKWFILIPVRSGK